MKPIRTHNCKIAGCLRDDGVFIVHKKEKHIFDVKGKKAIGMSWNILEKIKKNGGHRIIILLNTNDGLTKKYETTLKRWLEVSTIHKDGLGDWQRILPLDYFNSLENYGC